MLGTTSLASYYGPSFMIDDLIYHYTEANHHTILINCHYPIDANSFVLQYGIIVKKSDALPEDLAMQTAIALGDFVKMGFEQDVAIWQSKARIDNPLLVEEDGPVYQLRRWYEQFYVDVADVTPDMVDRFEHRARHHESAREWMKVVEANLAGLPWRQRSDDGRIDNRLSDCPMVSVVLPALRPHTCWPERAAGIRPACNGMPTHPRVAWSAANPRFGRVLGARCIPGLFGVNRLDRRGGPSRRLASRR